MEFCNLLRILGKIKGARRDLTASMELFSETKTKMDSLEQDKTEEYAFLLHDIHICYGRQAKQAAQGSRPREAEGLLTQSLEWADLSKAAYERAGATKTPDFANLYKTIGISLSHQGDKTGAMQAYETGKLLFEEVGVQMHAAPVRRAQHQP